MSILTHKPLKKTPNGTPPSSIVRNRVEPNVSLLFIKSFFTFTRVGNATITATKFVLKVL